MNKLNGKSHYYTKHFGNKNSGNENRLTLHLSKHAKNIIKEYPEFVNFGNQNLIFVNKGKRVSYEDSKLKIKLDPIKIKSGVNHSQLYKLDVLFKPENKNNSYFVKIANFNGLSSIHEFLANTIFEKFGLRTIKPHMSFESPSKLRNLIIYDFTGLKTLEFAIAQKLIYSVELDAITDKVHALYYYEKEIGLESSNNLRYSLGDFDRSTNIFIKKENNKLKIYFTDLFISGKDGIY